jgi:membrane fusion protein (multidrug efflux system)
MRERKNRPNKMIKSISVYISIFLISLTLSGGVFAQKHGGPKKPVAVIVSPALKADFTDQVEALGTTKANETVVITTDRSEKITEIHFDDGQQVKQGDILISLDKTQEEAELRAAEAITAETKNAYNRAKSLSGNSALPKAILQERLAELRQSQAETEAVKARLESYEITAPFDGVLGLREVSVGALIQPGDTITTLDDLNHIKVDFDVPSIFLATLKQGLPITGQIDAFAGRSFAGTVRTVNTQIDPITRTVKVRAIIPNNDHTLKPGLLMRITLHKNPREALLIREEALIKRGEKNFVYVVVQDGEAMTIKQTEITIGARKVGVIEVLSGLNAGDKIVTHGVSKVRDGAAVHISAEETQSEPLNSLLKQEQLTSEGQVR